MAQLASLRDWCGHRYAKHLRKALFVWGVMPQRLSLGLPASPCLIADRKKQKRIPMFLSWTFRGPRLGPCFFLTKRALRWDWFVDNWTWCCKQNQSSSSCSWCSLSVHHCDAQRSDVALWETKRQSKFSWRFNAKKKKRLTTASVSASTNEPLGLFLNPSFDLRILTQREKSFVKGAHAKVLKHPYCSKLVTILTPHSTTKEKCYIGMCSSIWNSMLRTLIVVYFWHGQNSQKLWKVSTVTTRF